MAGFFGFFDYTKPGKGVSKDEPEKSGFGLYFDILLKRFWKLITLNLIFIVASIPAIVIGWYISTYFAVWAASMAGINLEESASSLQLLSAFMSIILLLICGSGPASVGMAYVIRKYVNDTHSWVWSDFFEHLRKNFKQGIAAYVINVLVIILSLFAYLFYSYAFNNVFSVFLKTIIMIIAAVFIMMQMYVYQLIAGFELKIKHVYKNAFILTIAKLPWNVISVATVAFVVYGAFSLVFHYTLPGIIIIACLLFTLATFTEIFMTNNIVKKYILEPYMDANKVETVEIESDFSDTLI